MSNKLWGGRFKKKTDPQFEKFSSSLKWDRCLLSYDLAINATHVEALKKCGVLTSRETKRLLIVISSLEKKVRIGSWKPKEGFEDIHSAIQAELLRMAGVVAEKIHTARSRNDLVSQSTRLYCKDHAGRILKLVRYLQRELVKQAERNFGKVYGGMTHLQVAQVLLYSHILLAYVEMLERVCDKLTAAQVSSDVCVLGSGAIGGVTFRLDQKFMAKRLGLSSITNNSYDVVGDRDFVLDLLYAVSSLGVQLSRISEDFLIDKTRENTIVEMDSTFCTGSSMMPQKKNPDFIELVRGAGALFLSNFTGLALLLKGLPTSYNRDLQWDKRYLFESVGLCEEILDIFVRFVKTLELSEKQQKKIRKHFLEGAGQYGTVYATDIADYLVRKGVAFADAHKQVGAIVALAEEIEKPISRISLDLLKKCAPKAEGDVYEIFSPEHSVWMKKTRGGTHPLEVKKQIRQWKKRLK